MAVLSKPYSETYSESAEFSPRPHNSSTKIRFNIIPSSTSRIPMFIAVLSKPYSGTYSESAEFSPRPHTSSTKIRFNIVPSSTSSIPMCITK